MKPSTIAVLGAGSWGTAIAAHLATSGHPVMLWARNPQHVQDMQTTRINNRYLPNIPLPDQLQPSADIKACLRQAEEIIIAVPSNAFLDILNEIDKPNEGISWLTKGLEPQSHCLLSELIAKKWGNNFPIAVISGPSFAGEVAKGLPTALLLAGNNPIYLKKMHHLLHHNLVRVYESTDIIGVQWCGAVKNIIAIACGISDGLNYGANAKAALITRGLAEMSRIGMHFGGRQDTFMGLAGVGDLVLTCTDSQSRNRRFGLLLGQGTTSNDAEHLIGQVVEGKHNASQVCALAKKNQIDMPICQQVLNILQGITTPAQAVAHLMTRPAKEE